MKLLLVRHLWGVAEAEDFYGAGPEQERRCGVALAHETRRLCCFGNHWTTGS